MAEKHGGNSDEGLDDGLTYTLMGRRYYVVKKRWGILALVSFIMILDMFNFSFFSYVNDVTSFYFDIEPAVSDLPATISFVGRMTSVIVVCLLGEWMGFHAILISATAFNVIGALGISAGVLFKVFGLVVWGSFLTGNATSILMAVALLVAINWFPPDERGKANAAAWVSKRASTLISNQIATRALGINGRVNLTRNSSVESELVEQKFKIAFSSVFGCLAILTFVCLVITCFYASEKPPPVDEDAGTNLHDENTSILKRAKSYSLRHELKAFKHLFTNPSYVLITCILACIITERPLGDVLISSLVLNRFKLIDDQFVGVMLSVGIFLAAVCSPLAGQILDKLSKPRLTFLCFDCVTIVALSTFSLSFHFLTVTGVFAAFLIMWSTRDAVLVCVTHRFSAIMQSETDTMRMKASTLPVALTALASAISTTAIRIFLDNFGSALAVLFPMPFLLLSLLSYVFLWNYLRGTE